jgi:hypothetical protein
MRALMWLVLLVFGGGGLLIALAGAVYGEWEPVVLGLAFCVPFSLGAWLARVEVVLKPDGEITTHGLFWHRETSADDVLLLRIGQSPAGMEWHIYVPGTRRIGLPISRAMAALMVAEGAHALSVSRRLGHSSIAVTFDTYGHLFPDREEALTEALDTTYRAAESGLLREDCAKVGT